MHQFNRQDCMHGVRQDLFNAFAPQSEIDAESLFRKNKVEFIVSDTDLLLTRNQT